MMNEQERAAFLEARRQGIGGSDAPAILGLVPWKSPLHIYGEKRGEISDDVVSSEAMEWGNILEPIIADEYAKRTGRKVRRQRKAVRSKEHPFMQAHLDRWVTDPEKGRGVLQIKTTNIFKGGDWDNEAPVHVQVQHQHEMYVAGATWGSIAVLIGGQKLAWLDQDINTRFLEVWCKRALEFWERVQKGDPPPVGNETIEQDIKALAALFPQEEEGKSVVLPEGAIEISEERDAALAAQKEAKKKADYCTNRLKELMGDAEFGVLPDQSARFRWNVIEMKGYSVDPKSFRKFSKVKMPKE